MNNKEKKQIIDEFTPKHHALLFAWLSRAVIKLAGEDEGEKVIRKAIRIYGEQRGKRMALRAKANGHQLTMANFFAYGEWLAAAGEMKQTMPEKTPNAKVIVEQCPWHETWEKADLMNYGRFYCMEIDKALIHGFNPELRLDVNSTQSNDNIPCEFIFYQANLNKWNSLLLKLKKTFKPGKKALMPWHYHCRHLYKTVSELIALELPQIGNKVVNLALEDFTAHFGVNQLNALLDCQDIDFNLLPS